MKNLVANFKEISPEKQNSGSKNNLRILIIALFLLLLLVPLGLYIYSNSAVVEPSVSIDNTHVEDKTDKQVVADKPEIVQEDKKNHDDSMAKANTVVIANKDEISNDLKPKSNIVKKKKLSLDTVKAVEVSNGEFISVNINEFVKKQGAERIHSYSARSFADGEWASYKIKTSEPGEYLIRYSLFPRNVDGGGRIRFEVNDQTTENFIPLAADGSPALTTQQDKIFIESGVQTIRIVGVGEGFNLVSFAIMKKPTSISSLQDLLYIFL